MITAVGLLLAASAAAGAPGPGVSENLANERSGLIRSLRYDLRFQIPARRTDAIRASEMIHFALAAPHRIVLDFSPPRDHVGKILVDGRPVEAGFADGHIIIPDAATRTGENEVSIEFIAGDESLNRNQDFLYTLFVPARAHLAFPCFDQPDLKARYRLTLDIPSAWRAVANGAETPPAEKSSYAARRLIRFAETQPLPTYLFAFAAGNFQVETAERNGRTFRMFHRETASKKVARNRDALFDLHAHSLAWLEDYTGIRYPWGKFDFILIPSFQFGGMEHAGAILYNASGLMLDESATQNQLLGRASTIAHETAHMWFGDLVTMRWFNDVWMKEVMANFMAAKVVNPSFPNVNHPLRFLMQHFPAAYDVDRTAGSNPIRQKLANLDEAGTLYGDIIYNKAPIAMRQLEDMVGEAAFRDGLREYLRRYSFGNATWLDLVRILDARGPGNIARWSRAWVEQRGRPQIATTLRVGADGKIAHLELTGRDPLGRGLVWPQRLRLALGYRGHVVELPVLMDGPVARVAEAQGRDRPLFVIPNAAGSGYGLFLLDSGTRQYLLEHIQEIPDPLLRGSAWIDLWENMLEAQVAPQAFIDLALGALPGESDQQNVQRVLSYLSHAFWRFLAPQDRLAKAPRMEAVLRQGIGRARTQSEKSAWFSTYRDVALTRDSLAWLERIWRREEEIEGLTFSENDEINLALELAVRDVPDARQILAAQLARTENPDRKERFEFVLPALARDPTARAQAFERLRDASNRRHEPWVLESLRYLNHPLRGERRFLAPSLELLPEIQRTGDIFFPTRWMDAALSGQPSPEAASTVREFLRSHPNLPERLRWTVLAAADDLFRAVRIQARK